MILANQDGLSSNSYTAFSSPLGNLQFCHLTLRLASALSIFTKLMRKLTSGRKDMVSYLDDILIFHMTIDEHINGVRSLLETILKFGLTIRPMKTFVVTKEVNFLEYIIKQG